MSDLTQFDAYLNEDGPAALVIREHLMPVEGPDGVLFPSTFAAGDGFSGGYNIDPRPTKDEPWKTPNVCLIDSLGSQANRLEPMFAKDKYARLIPQVTVKAGDKVVNLLEAGHRAGDAIIRCTPLQQVIQDAFKALQRGNAEPLAKVAPTSMVFGVWDSRDTQAKLPRLIASTIRAFNVTPLTRSAQYIPAVEYTEQGLLEEPGDLKDAEGRVKTKHPFAQRGFAHVPASGSHGGIIATGGIRRDATLHLAALRLLTAGSEPKRTIALQRYVLGLALVAFTGRPSSYLRQGCNLVPDPDKAREFVEVHGDGRRVPATVTHDAAVSFAQAAAADFVVGEDQAVEFDKELARQDVAGDPEGKGKSKKARK